MISKPQLTYNQVTNPFPDQTPVQILTRNYKIAQLSWGAVPASTYFDFPSTLLAIPNIAARLTGFRWMRAGVKIQVKINATQFHYGAYLISWIPNHIGTSHSENIYKQSGNHPIVLSPAIQNTCTITVPWINPYSYFEIASATSDIVRFCFTPITALGTANEQVTDTINLSIFASFVDPEVAGYVAQSGNKMKHESIEKSRFGMLDTIGEVTKGVTSVLEKIPIIGEVAGSFASVISMMDKPTSDVASQPMSLTFSRDMSHGSGLDNCQSLSLLPLSYVNLDRKFMGESVDEMDLIKVAQTPMIHIIAALDNTTQTSYSFSAVPQANANMDYLGFITDMFGFWRGSIKYKFCFYTSMFTTGRYRIQLVYNSTFGNDENQGDVLSRVIDVKGDTIFDLTVPYLWPTLYRPTNDVIAQPQITISPVMPIIGPSSDSDPIIFMVVWRAGGEDIRFNQLVTATLEIPSPDKKVKKKKKEFVAQMDMQAEFKKIFDPIVEGSYFVKEKGTITGEHIVSMHDVVKRYVTGPPVTGNDPTATLNTYPNTAQPGAYHYLSRIFKYWRGSRRVKMFPLVPEGGSYYCQAAMQNPANSFDAGNGIAITEGNVWPMLEVEVPWYSTLPFIPTDYSNVPVYNIIDNPRDLLVFPLIAFQNTNYISAGDDFTYGFLYAPL